MEIPQTEKNTLHTFGNVFQTKCIALLISDRAFLEQIMEILSPDYFDNEAYRWVVKLVMDYFPKYKAIPTFEVFKVEIMAINNVVLQAAVYKQVEDAYGHISASDIAYVKEQFLKFARNQKLKGALHDATDLLKTGDYDGIWHIINEASRAGLERNLGHDYFVDIDARMVDAARETIKTNWDIIDTHLDGGLGKGELGFVVAPAGSGKCVSKSCKVKIQYEEIGVPIIGNSGIEYIIWINPFEKYDFGEKIGIIFGWQLNLIFNRQLISERIISEEITIKDLFEKLGVKNYEHAQKNIDFQLRIKTPHGYKNIVSAFRTEKQKTVTTCFLNNRTLKSSANHLLKVNGKWMAVKDIKKDDIVETEEGVTSIVRKYYSNKEEILYDISVQDVHCYYSNGIVSHNSWFLARIGAEAMKQGKNVMHFTMELNEKYVGLRYDAIFSGIAFQDIRKSVPTVKKAIEEAKSKGCGKLFVKYYPLKTASAATLKMYIDRFQLITGLHIDMAIVDYADILRPFVTDKNANSYNESGNVYEELRQILGELQIPGWTCSQSNRGAHEEEIIQAGNVADSYRKIMTGDFILSLSRRMEDKLAGTGRIYVMKNRFGPDGVSYPCTFDTSCGKINIYDTKSIEGMEILNRAKTAQESIKDILRKRWKQTHDNDSE